MASLPFARPILIMALFSFAQAPAQNLFPGVVAVPIAKTPLAGSPTVVALARLDQAQMSEADYQVVSNLRAELAKEAALANFDIANPDWHFQQVVCPALPDYVLLSFVHGADASGSSRFGAVLSRRDADVQVISTYAHGLLPFTGSWNRSGTFEVFNKLLKQERGDQPLSHAPDWLAISLCYAELSGYPVQVPSVVPNPGPTLDLLRLDANRPQMFIGSDQSADVSFSDVSRPGLTTNWKLHFNRHGELTAVSRSQAKQPEKIALKP